MSFDSFAPHYRTMETILAGTILQRCRIAFLPHVGNCRQALLLGEGPGRFLVELLTANARIEVVCVEQSPRMIEESRRALRQRGIDLTRVQFVQMDVLEWRPAAESFDLVATHFFLDCFRREEIEQLISTVAKGVKDDAIWLISDFRLPACGWRRRRAWLALQLMYQFFRRTTGISASWLTDPGEPLRQAEFRLSDQRLGNFGFIHSSLWLFDGAARRTTPAAQREHPLLSPFAC